GLAQQARELVAGHAGHHHVGHQRAQRTDLFGHLDRFGAARGHRRLVAGVAQHPVDKTQHRFLVVYDEDRALCLHRLRELVRQGFDRSDDGWFSQVRPQEISAIPWRSRRRYNARRLMPSILAAAMRFPLTCRRTSTMCPRSTELSAGENARPCAVWPVAGAGPRLASMSRSVMRFPSASMHARSTTFFSSRTLPSQEAVSSSRSATAVIPVKGLRMRWAQSPMNAAVRYGMSSRRSRSGGSSISTTLSR